MLCVVGVAGGLVLLAAGIWFWQRRNDDLPPDLPISSDPDQDVER